MDIMYTYNITKLYTSTSETFTDIVSLIEWEIIGTLETISLKLTASTKLPPPSSDNFIEFDNLSKEQVLFWLKTVDPDTEILKEHLSILLIKEFERKALTSKDYLPWEADREVIIGGV